MIEIWTETLPEGFRWSPDNYLGGTPEFYIETATLLAKKDDVVVYYDGEATEYKGVTYLPREYYQAQDIVLSCNEKPPHLGKKNIYWTNKVGQKSEDYQEFDHRITLSKYHQSIFGESVIIGHGIHPDQFEGIHNKVNKQCLYSSSPDRGGEFLKSILPEVEKTGAKLICTYDKSISEQEMIELYKSSQFWLHPCQGVELFCISALKAQASGCIPIIIPNMALADTVQWGIKTDLEHYKDELIKAIISPPSVKQVKLPTWHEQTDKLFTLF